MQARENIHDYTRLTKFSYFVMRGEWRYVGASDKEVYYCKCGAELNDSIKWRMRSGEWRIDATRRDPLHGLGSAHPTPAQGRPGF